MNNFFLNGLLFWAGFSLVLLIFLLVRLEQLRRHYQRLMGVKKGNLQNVLEGLITRLDKGEKERQKLTAELANLKERQKRYLGRWGLVKFNPFSETGGKQSFVLAILDDLKRGLLLTSFHTRTGSRVYAKIIESAKEKSFSEEEKLAIKKAEEKGEK